MFIFSSKDSISCGCRNWSISYNHLPMLCRLNRNTTTNNLASNVLRLIYHEKGLFPSKPANISGISDRKCLPLLMDDRILMENSRRDRKNNIH
jgi:hypothetical protein